MKRATKKIFPNKYLLWILFYVTLFLVSFFITIFKFQTAFKSQKLPLSGSPEKLSDQEVNITLEPKKFSILVAGDVMLGRKVMIEAEKRNNYLFPFEKVTEKLKGYDLVFINLENPIIQNCPEHIGGFKFCSPSETAQALRSAGVDIVNLANNHSLNYGQTGINETKVILKENEIGYTGAGNLYSTSYDAGKFGFLGFDFTVNEPVANDYELIKIAAKEVDILIVAVHWGVEYTDRPTERQRQLAKQMVQSGADVIVGTHPHWVQGIGCFMGGIETYIPASEFKSGQTCQAGSVPVFYSLGNFIFDQMWSEETKKGAIVELNFGGRTLLGSKMENTYIRDWGQVEVVSF